GEFHYLGLQEALAALEAAAEAEIDLVLILAAYEREGLPRFRQESVAAYLRQVESLRATGARVAVAPHSVRACSAGWLEEIGRCAPRARDRNLHRLRFECPHRPARGAPRARGYRAT